MEYSVNSIDKLSELMKESLYEVMYANNKTVGTVNTPTTKCRKGHFKKMPFAI